MPESRTVADSTVGQCKACISYLHVDAVGGIDIDPDAGKKGREKGRHEITGIVLPVLPVHSKGQTTKAQAAIAARETEKELEIVSKLQSSLTWVHHSDKFLFCGQDCTLVFSIVENY